MKAEQNALQSSADQPDAASLATDKQLLVEAVPDLFVLRRQTRWDDLLRLIQFEEPARIPRVVLAVICVLVLALLVWAIFGRLDIIATADGKLVPQTLVKIVQPAESGVVSEILVSEGDRVKAGQVLVRLDATVARADRAGLAETLAVLHLQMRRVRAELDDQPMLSSPGDAPLLFAQVQQQYLAHRKAWLDGIEQERLLLQRSEYELKSATQILSKLEQTLPSYLKSADSYARLGREGFFSDLAAAEKQREAIEKKKDLDAQVSSVAALNATIAAQGLKIRQLQSQYKSELQRELANLRARVAQLQPDLDKSIYRHGLMELKAPQDGIIKDLATTTRGAVVQPGSILMTLVPANEALYADVSIRNEDVGFVQIGQAASVKLAAYPFQKYGMLTGRVSLISADASAPTTGAAGAAADAPGRPEGGGSIYKARLALDGQSLIDTQGVALPLTPGMQIVAEIRQGQRTVMEYLLSPVQKALGEAGRER